MLLAAGLVAVAAMPPGEESVLVQAGEAAAPSDDVEAALAPQFRIYELAERDDGRRLRADFEPPRVLLVVFTEQWAAALADLLAVAAGQTRVVLLVDPSTTTAAQLRAWLDRHGLDGAAFAFVWIRLDSAWVRDFGPFELVERDGRRVWLDAAYGPDRHDDDAAPTALARKFDMPLLETPLSLQGGGFISNGRGLCAVTAEYLVDNDLALDDPAGKDLVMQTLGCRMLAVVPALRDEPTRHADMLAQFLAPDLVAVAEVRLGAVDTTEDRERMDAAAAALREAARRLGQPLRVVRVPLYDLGDGRYRTYLNGLRLAGDYLVPSYHDVPDDIEAAAYRILSEAMPGTHIVPIPSDAILERSGSLHCITAGLTPPWSGIAGAGDPLDATDTCDDEDRRDDLECHADTP